MSTPANTYQWLLNGDTIPGATSQTFVPTISGDYTVLVDCVGTGTVVSNLIPVIVMVGISEASFLQLKMYPNPVSAVESELVLALQGLENKPLMLVLTDLSGREFLRKTAVAFSEKIILQTGDSPAGTYFVQVWQEGRMVAMGMFLKI